MADENEDEIAVDLQPMTGSEAERFSRGEAMGTATLRHAAACRLLHSCGFQVPGEGSGLLDRIATFLDSPDVDMLDESGGLLNSAEATLQKGTGGDIYFMGLNPGADGAKDYSILDDFPTVFESLVFSRLGVSGWDQDWSRKDAHYEPGQAPIQRRFKHIARLLGLAYGDILATNLVFARSGKFRALKGIDAQIRACLPVHQMMIDVVQPTRLWVMGSPAQAGIALKLHDDVQWRRAHHQESADWSVGYGTAEFCGRTMTFCNTPHLSYWDATGEEKQKALEFAFSGKE